MYTAPIKYTPKIIEIIKANIQLPKKELAKMIGVKESGLRRKISILRKDGVDIPRLVNPIGTIQVRKDGRFKRKFIKVSKSRWQRVPLTKEDIEARRPFYVGRKGLPKPKVKINKITKTTVGKQDKPELKKFSHRTEDMTNKHYVKIDNRTWALRRKTA